MLRRVTLAAVLICLTAYAAAQTATWFPKWSTFIDPPKNTRMVGKGYAAQDGGLYAVYSIGSTDEIVKYDSSGNVQWRVRMAGQCPMLAEGVSGLYVAGDSRTVKLNKDTGAIIWQRRDTTRLSADVIHVDASDNVWVGANLLERYSSSGSLTYRTIPFQSLYSYRFIHQMGADAQGNLILFGVVSDGNVVRYFVLKYTSTGAYAWSHFYDRPSDTTLPPMLINVRKDGTCDLTRFGPDATGTSATYSGAVDHFDPNGVLLSSYATGFPIGIGSDSNNNSYVFARQSHTVSGGSEYFSYDVAKLSSTGQVLWHTDLPNHGADGIFSTDGDNGVFIHWGYKEPEHMMHIDVNGNIAWDKSIGAIVGATDFTYSPTANKISFFAHPMPDSVQAGIITDGSLLAWQAPSITEPHADDTQILGATDVNGNSFFRGYLDDNMQTGPWNIGAVSSGGGQLFVLPSPGGIYPKATQIIQASGGGVIAAFGTSVKRLNSAGAVVWRAAVTNPVNKMLADKFGNVLGVEVLYDGLHARAFKISSNGVLQWEISLLQRGDVFATDLNGAFVVGQQSGGKMYKLSPAGAVQWTVDVPPLSDIAIDHYGNIYTMYPARSIGTQVRKYDTNGIVQWTQDIVWGDSTLLLGQKLYIDSNDDLRIVGHVTYDGYTSHTHIAVYKVTKVGGLVWHTIFGLSSLVSSQFGTNDHAYIAGAAYLIADVAPDGGIVRTGGWADPVFGFPGKVVGSGIDSANNFYTYGEDLSKSMTIDWHVMKFPALVDDDAVYVSANGVPASITHGSSFSATIRMRNTGTSTWDAANYGLVPIGTSNFGVSKIDAVTTPFNGDDPFTATFTAPSTPGTYTFQWQMAHNGTKFGNASFKFTINVS